MKYAYAVKQGEYHKSNNEKCQDILAYNRRNSIFALCLCDGAGSKKYAYETADIVSNYCAQFLSTKDYLREINGQELLEKLNGFINEYSCSRHMPLEEMGTTAIFFWCNDKEFYVGHIGDGAVFGVKDDYSYIISDEAKGEYMNETYLIPDIFSKQKIDEKKGMLDKLRGFVIATDGISGALYGKGKEVFPACLKFVKWLNEVGEEDMKMILYDNIEQIFDKYNDDDKSIVVISL